MGKRKAAVLALLGGYGSGSEGGSGSEESAGPESPAEAPLPSVGPAVQEPAAEAGPAWPQGGYEALPEALPEEEEALPAGDAEGSVEDALASLRHISIPPELVPGGVLPPPVSGPVRPELQAKLERFAQLTAAGRSITGELRGSRGYRNPEFLGQLVVRYGIREHASAYPPAVFDPETLPAEDYFEALMTAQRVAAEEKEAERKRTGRVDFVPPWSQQNGAQRTAPPPAWRPGQLPALPVQGRR